MIQSNVRKTYNMQTYGRRRHRTFAPRRISTSAFANDGLKSNFSSRVLLGWCLLLFILLPKLRVSHFFILELQLKLLFSSIAQVPFASNALHQITPYANSILSSIDTLPIFSVALLHSPHIFLPLALQLRVEYITSPRRRDMVPCQTYKPKCFNRITSAIS